MKNKILILFNHYYKNININAQDIKKLKKNYFDVILYNNFYQKRSEKIVFNEKKLNLIHKNYQTKKIKINLEEIYSINFFLKKIKTKFKNKKFYISTFSLNNSIVDDIIIYELSKIYKMQYLKPQRSFIKNRYILSKNLFRQHYNIRKKTIVSTKQIDTLKVNYILAMDSYRKSVSRRKESWHFNFFSKFIIYILSLIFKFKINKKPRKYALMILGNSLDLNALATAKEFKIFVNKFLKNFDYQLVFLIHPNTSILKYLLWQIKNMKIFFNSKRITFIQKPKSLVKIMSDSEFVFHLTSSASAQALIFNKRILCIGKNLIYLSYLNNLVTNINQNNFNFLKRKINRFDIYKINKFFVNLLSNSVDCKGEFKLSTDKKYYASNFVYYKKRYRKKIIINLLNSI